MVVVDSFRVTLSRTVAVVTSAVHRTAGSAWGPVEEQQDPEDIGEGSERSCG